MEWEHSGDRHARFEVNKRENEMSQLAAVCFDRAKGI